MDGHLPRLARAHSPRLAALALAAAVAALLLLALAPAAARADDSPAARWPATGSTLRTALAMGAEHWGMQPCDGRVAFSWTTTLGAGTNAQSSWANDRDPYLQPSSNTDCAIALSLATDWDWVKLCSIVIHEVGHLTGHDHVDDPTDIMYYAYVAPAPECAATPEPVETGAAPAQPRAAAPKRTPTAKPAKARPTKRAAKRAAKKRRARQR